MTTKKRSSRLIKGSLEATLQASRAVDELQEVKLRRGNEPGFCYFDNVEENWDEVVGQKTLASTF